MSRRRILAVDDEPDILDSMATLLPMLVDGVEVVCAESGPAGLERLQEERFDLVISDYRMGPMDGLEFLEKAQAMVPGLKAVLMTAYPDPLLAAEARRNGVVAFLPKPFDLDQVVEVIRKHMD